MTFPLITDINIGDIYISKQNHVAPRLIAMSAHENQYLFLGFYGLKAFDPINNKLKNQSQWTKQEAIDNLNENDFYLAANINEKVEKSLDLANKQIKEKWAAENAKNKLKAIKLDIPNGYNLLGLNDIVPHNAKCLWGEWNKGDWCNVVNSIGKTVKWGKENWGDDIEYIVPIKD